MGPSFAWLVAECAMQAFATGVVSTMSPTLVLITVPLEGGGAVVIAAIPQRGVFS